MEGGREEGWANIRSKREGAQKGNKEELNPECMH